MIYIQCKQDMFDLILKAMEPYEPRVVEEKGGYIDCFDKDWIFVQIDRERFITKWLDVIQLVGKSNMQFIFAYISKDNSRLIQQEIAENEKYIFCRKDKDNKYIITHGASSYIIFDGTEVKNEA